MDRPILPEFRASLYRKYQKVSQADSIYAFGILEGNRKEVRGSQGWSVQMGIQLGKNVYVYDEITLTWYQGDTFLAVDGTENITRVRQINRFKPCDELPTLDKKSTIVLPQAMGIKTQEELQRMFFHTLRVEQRDLTT